MTSQTQFECGDIEGNVPAGSRHCETWLARSPLPRKQLTDSRNQARPALKPFECGRQVRGGALLQSLCHSIEKIRGQCEMVAHGRMGEFQTSARPALKTFSAWRNWQTHRIPGCDRSDSAPSRGVAGSKPAALTNLTDSPLVGISRPATSNGDKSAFPLAALIDNSGSGLNAKATQPSGGLDNRHTLPKQICKP